MYTPSYTELCKKLYCSDDDDDDNDDDDDDDDDDDNLVFYIPFNIILSHIKMTEG